MVTKTGDDCLITEKNGFFYPPEALSKKAYIKSMEEYQEIYAHSIEDPESYWAEKAKQVVWVKKWNKVLEANFREARHEWFVGGKLNVSYNCLDKHLTTHRKNKAALIWEGEPDGDNKTYTYQQLYNEVCRFSNVLKKLGIKKGDRIFIYLPLIPELVISMLACARIGAIHHITYAGFSSQTIQERIQNCGASLFICCDGYYRNGKVLDSKVNADLAMAVSPSIKTAIIVKRSGSKVTFQEGRDYWWHELISANDITAVNNPEPMDSEDPLFLLYTSGTTGKPKGMIHTQGGYLVFIMENLKCMLDVRDDDTYWCTAYIGAYFVYGPMALGLTGIMYEGAFDYPEPDRIWSIVENNKVNVLYTAPSDIKSLMKQGNSWPEKHDLTSLRVIGLVGEPIGNEAWNWCYEVIGKKRCPISDTWGQNEAGGILICPLPGAVPLKPGSATFPLPGIDVSIIRDDGTCASIDEPGYLVIRSPWPGLMRGVWGNPEQFKSNYFLHFPGVYDTGDTAKIDQNGYFWILGRSDDDIKVYGYRVSPAKIENALIGHPWVAEVAAVGVPHEIKGQGVYVYAVLKPGVVPTADLENTLINYVSEKVDSLAIPEKIQFVQALPKTLNGKTMRRILAKIAAGDISNLGDTSALANPAAVSALVKNTKNKK